jgi:hypothetical protein
MMGVLHASLVRVVLVQRVLHVQMTRMMVDMMTTMMWSDHMCYIQLAAPLCLVCHCWTFVVMDDKGGEILIKASDVFHMLSLYLETCTVAIVCYELHCCILRLRY